MREFIKNNIKQQPPTLNKVMLAVSALTAIAWFLIFKFGTGNPVAALLTATNVIIGVIAPIANNIMGTYFRKQDETRNNNSARQAASISNFSIISVSFGLIAGIIGITLTAITGSEMAAGVSIAVLTPTIFPLIWAMMNKTMFSQAKVKMQENYSPPVKKQGHKGNNSSKNKPFETMLNQSISNPNSESSKQMRF